MMDRRSNVGARVLLVFIALTVWTLSDVSGAVAQKKASDFEQKIQGTWILVSIYNELDGKKSDVFGSSPRGSMILTPEGRFSIIIMKASLPKFASNNRVKGTPEEYQAVVEGSVAYFGTYKAATEKENTVSMQIEGSTFPNWDGQNQARIMVVVGDEMKLTNPVAAVSGTNHLVWKRAK